MEKFCTSFKLHNTKKKPKSNSENQIQRSNTSLSQCYLQKYNCQLYYKDQASPFYHSIKPSSWYSIPVWPLNPFQIHCFPTVPHYVCYHDSYPSNAPNAPVYLCIQTCFVQKSKHLFLLTCCKSLTSVWKIKVDSFHMAKEYRCCSKEWELHKLLNSMTSNTVVQLW